MESLTLTCHGEDLRELLLSGKGTTSYHADLPSGKSMNLVTKLSAGITVNLTFVM